MLTSDWFCVLVGAVLGFLSGLGVGGGSLLMLWLTLILGVAQSQARLMNLMFFIPCALIASLFRRKQGNPDWKLTLTAIAAGLLGSILGSVLTAKLDMDFMRKCFGVLFLVCGFRELFYRPRKAK